MIDGILGIVPVLERLGANDMLLQVREMFISRMLLHCGHYVSAIERLLTF